MKKALVITAALGLVALCLVRFELVAKAPDTPAAAAGVQAEDIVVGADEVEFVFVGDLIDYIDQVKGEGDSVISRECLASSGSLIYPFKILGQPILNRP